MKINVLQFYKLFSIIRGNLSVGDFVGLMVLVILHQHYLFLHKRIRKSTYRLV
jgi:hypothetical protein